MTTYTLLINTVSREFTRVKIDWDADGKNIHTWEATLADITEAVTLGHAVEIKRDDVSFFKGMLEVINPTMDESGAIKVVSGRHVKTRLWRKWIESYLGDANWRSYYPNKIVEFLLHPSHSDEPTLDTATYRKMGYGIDSDGWTCTASVNNGDADLVSDRLETVGWDSGINQANGQWIKIDLGSAKDICGVRISNRSLRTEEYVRSYKVETSLNDADWTEKATKTGNKAISIVESWTSASARYIKVTCTGAFADHWTISNIFVYESDGEISGISVGTLTEHLPFNCSLMDENAGVGQKDVTVEEGWKFQEGDSVIIGDDNAEEYNTVATIVADVLTMEDNLANNYTTADDGYVTNYEREVDLDLNYMRLHAAIDQVVTLCTTSDVEWQWEVTDAGVVNMGPRIGSDASGSISFVYQTNLIRSSNKEDDRKRIDRVMVLGGGKGDERDRISSGWQGSGNYELIHVDTSLNTKEACIAKAKALLDEYNAPREVVASVDDTHATGTWVLGDDVTLTDALTGLAGSYRIRKITRTYDSNGERVIINTSTGTTDLADIISELSRRQFDGEVYYPEIPSTYVYMMTREANRYDIREQNGNRIFSSTSAHAAFDWVINNFPDVGGVFYIAPGKYPGLHVTISQLAMQVAGAGREKTILVPSTGNYAITYTAGGADTTYQGGDIRNLSVKDDGVGTTYGIKWLRQVEQRVENVEIDVTEEAYTVIAGARGKFLNIKATSDNGAGIHLKQGENAVTGETWNTGAKPFQWVQLTRDGIGAFFFWLKPGTATIAGEVEGVDFEINWSGGLIRGIDAGGMAENTNYDVDYTWIELCVDHLFEAPVSINCGTYNFWMDEGANGYQLIKPHANSTSMGTPIGFYLYGNWSAGMLLEPLVEECEIGYKIESSAAHYCSGIKMTTPWAVTCGRGIVFATTGTTEIYDTQISEMNVGNIQYAGLKIDGYVKWARFSGEIRNCNTLDVLHAESCSIIIGDNEQYLNFTGLECYENTGDAASKQAMIRILMTAASTRDVIIKFGNVYLQDATTAKEKIELSNTDATETLQVYMSGVKTSAATTLADSWEIAAGSTGAIVILDEGEYETLTRWGTHTAENEVRNSGFEIDLDRDGIPDFWQLDPIVDADSDGVIALDDTLSAEGYRCIKVTAGDAADRISALSDFFRINPQLDYYVAAFAKSSVGNANGDITIVLYGYTLAKVYVGHHDVVSNEDNTNNPAWDKFDGFVDIDADIGANVAYCRLGLVCDTPTAMDNGTASVWFDTATVRKAIVTEIITDKPILGKDFRTAANVGEVGGPAGVKFDASGIYGFSGDDTKTFSLLSASGVVTVYGEGMFVVAKADETIIGYLDGTTSDGVDTVHLRAGTNKRLLLDATGEVISIRGDTGEIHMVHSGSLHLNTGGDIIFYTNFVPDTNDVYTIGTLTKRIKELYADEVLTSGQIIIRGGQGGNGDVRIEAKGTGVIWLQAEGLEVKPHANGTVSFGVAGMYWARVYSNDYYTQGNEGQDTGVFTVLDEDGIHTHDLEFVSGLLIAYANDF